MILPGTKVVVKHNSGTFSGKTGIVVSERNVPSCAKIPDHLDKKQYCFVKFDRSDPEFDYIATNRLQEY